jgi:hypothetical protein
MLPEAHQGYDGDSAAAGLAATNAKATFSILDITSPDRTACLSGIFPTFRETIAFDFTLTTGHRP